MNSKYMGCSYERRDEERKELKRQIEETKLVGDLIECKRKLLLLDREEVLEEMENKKEKILNLEKDIKELKTELTEIDSAIKEHNKEELKNA